MKKKLALTISMILALAAFPLSVRAAETAEGWGWIETLGRWFNLALLFGLIYYFLRRPLVEFFTERRRKIQQDLEAAARAHAEAEEKLAEIQRRLEGLEQELEQIRQSAHHEAERERLRILDQARAEADKLVASAQSEVEGLIRAARQDLQRYTAQLAVELAEEKIRTRMDREAEKKVTERFFVKLSGRRGDF